MIDPDLIEDPPGFCRVAEIPSTLFSNAEGPQPWRVRRGPAPRDLFSAMAKAGVGDVNFEMRSAVAAKHAELLALIERGLANGELRSVGLLFDVNNPSGCGVALTPAHWRLHQVSAYAPLEPAKSPIAWATSVQMIRLFPEMDGSPYALPLILEADLAAFLDAEVPPPRADARIVPWVEWRSEFLAESASRRKAKTRKGGRPTDPTQNKAMWHEVVRRAAAGELGDATLAHATRTIHEWMSVKFAEPPDETTIRRQLKGISP